MSKYEVTTSGGVYEVDTLEKPKYGQLSVSSQGLSYVKEHPFKTALQPLAQTLTGKSLQERALEATAPKELPVRQIGRTAIGPTERDFTGQFLKQALAGMAGSAADIATTPASYVPIPGAQFAGKIPVGSTTVGRIAKNIAVRPGFVKGVGELQRLESALQQSGKLSSRGIPVTAAPLDVRSTNTIWGLYNEIAGTKFKKVSDVTQAKPQRVTAMRTISENLNDVKLPNPQTGELETRIPATRLELLDAFRQTKSSVWQKVNQLSSGATEKQAQIDLPKLAQQALQKTKDDIGDVALNTDKTLSTALEETVDRIRKSGVISPTKSEAYMKFLNNEIQRLRNSGQAVDFSVKDLYSNLLHGLNEATDQAIESALGTSGYRTFRNQYASLKSSEKELLGAANSFIKQTSGRLGGVTHPIANLWALEELLKGTGQIAMGNVAGGVKSIGQGVLAKTAVRILDHFRLPDRKISEIFQTVSKAKTLPVKQTFTPSQRPGIFPFPEGPTTFRRPLQGPPQLPYSTKQLPYLGRAPYKPTGYPGGVPPQKPMITPYEPGGATIRGQAPYRGTTLPAISPQPITPRQPLNLEQLRKSLQRKTQGQPLRGKHEVSPEQVIELPPRQFPQGKPLTAAEAVKQGMGAEEWVKTKYGITEEDVLYHGTNLPKGRKIESIEPRIGDFTRTMYAGAGEGTFENLGGKPLAYYKTHKDINKIKQYATGVAVYPKNGEPYILITKRPSDALLVKEDGLYNTNGDFVTREIPLGAEPGDIISEEGSRVLAKIPLKEYTQLLSEYEAAKGARGQNPLRNKSGQAFKGMLGPTMATGIGLAAALKATAVRGETGEVLDHKYKQQIANAENYGKTEGDWAQLEDIALRDLKRIGKLKQNVTLKQVKADPQLYDKVAKLYWDRLDAFGIPEKDKALWWLMPGRYRQTGGDISRLKNPEHRNIMRNRIKNIGKGK